MKARVKARIKATGDIVEVVFNGFYYESIKDERIFDITELEIIPKTKGLDYWTRLEHTYAGMAMQGLILTASKHMGTDQEVAQWACEYARALVEKLKEEK